MHIYEDNTSFRSQQKEFADEKVYTNILYHTTQSVICEYFNKMARAKDKNLQIVHKGTKITTVCEAYKYHVKAKTYIYMNSPAFLLF